jgi:hypothetical protein
MTIHTVIVFVCDDVAVVVALIDDNNTIVDEVYDDIVVIVTLDFVIVVINIIFASYFVAEKNYFTVCEQGRFICRAFRIHLI